MTIYFGLGSNLGNRLLNLRMAVNCLQSLGNVIAKSCVYETKAWGGITQPDYLNACVKLDMKKRNAMEILDDVKRFERTIGRVESIRWGARKIDIDILLMGNSIITNERLCVPHVNLHNRLFVLVPLGEIVPNEWRHPANHMSIHDMITRLDGEAWPVRITEL